MGLMWRKDPEQGLNSADHPPCGSDLAPTRRGQAPFQLRPGFLGAVKFHFREEPITPALPLLPQDPRARSCSYNQRRPFCVHLRGT